MPDEAEVHLDYAAVLFQNGEYPSAVVELLEAVRLLSREGSDLISSVSAEKFQTPVFSVVRQVFSVFDSLPNAAEISSIIPEAKALLPDHTAAPSEMLAAVSGIYESAGEDAPAGDAPNPSVIQLLIALLTGQQSMRDTLFSDTGMYMSAASSAAPYLSVLFTFSGDTPDAAAEKASALLFGPLKRLAELFYSLLTSSLTAGILLLVIRRAIPVLRPTKAEAAVDAVLLAASAIPLLIEGLRAVAAELSLLRRILSRAPHGNV